MIEVQGLIKRFKQLDVLRGVNMRVRRGDVAVLVGPSGSGKSTLLRCMNLLEEAGIAACRRISARAGSLQGSFFAFYMKMQ